MDKEDLLNMANGIRASKRERFQQSLPIFENFDKDRRDFAFKISSISATIGAFSFSYLIKYLIDFY